MFKTARERWGKRKKSKQQYRNVFQEMEERDQLVELMSDAGHDVGLVTGSGVPRSSIRLIVDSPDLSKLKASTQQIDIMRELDFVGDTLNDTNLATLLSALPESKLLTHLHIDCPLNDLEQVFKHFAHCRHLKRLTLGSRVTLHDQNRAAFFSFNILHGTEVLTLNHVNLPQILNYDSVMRHIRLLKTLTTVYLFINFNFQAFKNPDAQLWYDAHNMMQFHENIERCFVTEIAQPAQSQTQMIVEISRFGFRNRALKEAKELYQAAFDTMDHFSDADDFMKNFMINTAIIHLEQSFYFLEKAREKNHSELMLREDVPYINKVSVSINELEKKIRALNAACVSKIPVVTQNIMLELQKIGETCEKQDKHKANEAKSYLERLKQMPLMNPTKVLEEWTVYGHNAHSTWIEELIEKESTLLDLKNIQSVPKERFRLD